jgi:hypothetical protein
MMQDTSLKSAKGAKTNITEKKFEKVGLRHISTVFATEKGSLELKKYCKNENLVAVVRERGIIGPYARTVMEMDWRVFFVIVNWQKKED